MIRILVVSDVRFHRESVQRSLAAQEDFQVVDSAADEHVTLTVIAPSVRVVALGLSDTGRSVLPWAEAGVAGYVGQDCSLTEMVAVVRTIAEGGCPCTPDVSAALSTALPSCPTALCGLPLG
ncbi:hypothetical protein [Amycolatopsis sp. RTGN1]|uniref:hypothetical protein n=1 Tax=Amycolatopsis ponsaeliensis TaxID=2992142 RepID=UPI00254F4F5F|nr:hypothetical protein [Amycolatopsis sp. RTGN1]